METASSTGLIASVISLFTLLLLRPLAGKMNLLDVPDHRKAHKGAVPLIGGLSAFSGLLFTWLALMPLTEELSIFLLCALFMVLLGAVDDARDVPAKYRLGAQVLLGALLAYGAGIHLDTLGDILGLGEVSLGWLGPLVTIAAVIGATNAYNMIDGIDGLAGIMSLVTILSLALLFSFSPSHKLELVLAVTIAMAVLPYLAANLRIPPFRRKIFMGDAGSMFIGFSIVWLLVNGARAEEAVFRPVTALWVCAIPLMDMVAIMVRRARKGQSVMKPDRDHLHHIFLRAGFTDREALFVIGSVGVLFAAFGILGEMFAVPEWLMFALFMLVFAGYSWAISHVWRLLVLFRRRSHSA